MLNILLNCMISVAAALTVSSIQLALNALKKKYEKEQENCLEMRIWALKKMKEELENEGAMDPEKRDKYEKIIMQLNDLIDGYEEMSEIKKEK